MNPLAFFLIIFSMPSLFNCPLGGTNDSNLTPFYKCFLVENKDYILTDELVYFEIKEVDGAFFITKIIGKHSKEVYLKVFDALNCLKSKTVSFDSLKLIISFTESRDSDVKNERIIEFKEKNDLDDVEVLRVSFMKGS